MVEMRGVEGRSRKLSAHRKQKENKLKVEEAMNAQRGHTS